ncbi:DUF3347 domain-containing protein [Flavobacterium sp. J49]|uniref:DUF3347 domain-containing protein n=1 Tax=Flavobacterium sp. J49 TaxID=2718534 RepID=UPI00159421A9|nr:DUF3347 domain-containing protein [Flavobacterium sp. J49]MBF6640290.1 DUF3347 domain-containing protein [Flavobacterium sp. J49]NIC01535.1 DUF3347 domain-containing protein [Flavobacterium sp. J49]
MKTVFLLINLVLGFCTVVNGQSETASSKAFHETAITQTTFTTSEIVNGYLKIKNALVKSDSKNAAQTATALENTLKNINVSQLTAAQKPLLVKIAEESQKQSKVIAANSGKLDKQRKAFQQLSQSINELVTTFGTSQKLYQDFCPMYEGGSFWLSETKDIKNPYYGNQMLTCGKIKETIE